MEGLLKENDHKLKQRGIEFAESNVISDDDEEQQVHAVDKITTVGFGYKAPSYHALKVNLLVDAKKSVSLLIKSYRSQWTKSGCTIMSDGWRDIRQCHLINFLVYCFSGISFIKYVDASSIESNAKNLCNLFSEIVEMVGVKNVVQMVTDNGANYKAAWILLSERYRTVTWSSYAAHCLNLVLKDVSELDNIKEIITLASRVTVFIYNHKWPLNWLRKRYGWTKIIRPGATRFGTAFIALKCLVDHKNDLHAMVISNDFKKMLRVKNAIDFKQARKGIKDLFKNKKDLYQPYTKIINERWDKMLRTNIHCAAYWLNPTFQFDRENICKKRKVFQGVLDMAEKHYSGDELTDLNKAIGMFWDSKGNFGRISAVQGRTKHRPEEAQWELDYDQLKNMLEQEPPSQTQGLVDEDDDDSVLRLLCDRELDTYNTPMSQ
uniref:DUF659 domain-containing protein n=1 Tax=Tanacetum cinerariifolium TaxID=118510 RepID=A0A6L2N8S7_TANCI|nr:hypothetical protein [Tanacetum cinerariifolium]